MTPPIVVQIVGAPVACAEGLKDTWREVAALAGDQLGRRFGETVRVDYFDLFDPTCPLFRRVLSCHSSLSMANSSAVAVKFLFRQSVNGSKVLFQAALREV